MPFPHILQTPLVAQLVKNLPATQGWIPGLGRSPGEENVNPLQYSGLEISMECIARGVTKSQTRLSDFLSLLSFTFSSDTLSSTKSLPVCCLSLEWTQLFLKAMAL